MKVFSLHLKDFQCHADLEIKFSSRITTLLGPTDCGKSAVLRALRWGCLNDFQGEGFVREGARRAEVEVVFREGDKSFLLVRVKGGGVNLYVLDGKEYRSFGTGVPEDIQRKLQLHPLHFQDQHDPPFWFHETAGEVSRRLNAVVDLSVMDSALGYVAGRLRQWNDKKDWHQEEAAKLQKELEAFTHLDRQWEDFQRLKARHVQLEESRATAVELENLLEGVQRKAWEYRGERDRFREGETVLNMYATGTELKRQEFYLGKVLQAISEADGVLGVSLHKMQQGDRVVAGYGRYRTLRAQAEGLHTLLGDIQEASGLLSHPPPVEAFERFAHLRRKGLWAQDEKEKLGWLLEKITQLQNALKGLKAVWKTVEDRFHQEVEGQACPLCGQEIHFK